MNLEGIFQELPSLFTVLQVVPCFEECSLYKVSKVVSLTRGKRPYTGKLAKSEMIVGANFCVSDVIIHIPPALGGHVNRIQEMRIRR